MKNLNKQIKLKYLLVFNFLIFIVLFFLYDYLNGIIEKSHNDISIVFMLFGMSIFMLSFLMYMFLKKQNEKLLEDVERLSEHIQEISNKKYDSKVKIKYYADFLQISLYLKNIVKRLNK